MANIIDYLDWRGDLSFRKAPFNDVDNLILAELAYTRMEDIVPGPESEETVSIEKLCEEYERLEHSVKGNANNAFLMFMAALLAPLIYGENVRTSRKTEKIPKIISGTI